MNSTELSQLSYPVFRIGEKKPEIKEGVIFFFNHYESNEEDVEDKTVFKVVDDIREPGDRLGRRRLRLLNEGVRLQRLGHAIFFLGDLIKIARPTTWFIDSVGKLFNYKKSTRAKLRFHKVETILPIQSGGCIITLQDIATRFKSLYYPEKVEDREYVGILHFGKSLVMYGFYDDKYDDTWRMI